MNIIKLQDEFSQRHLKPPILDPIYNITNAVNSRCTDPNPFGLIIKASQKLAGHANVITPNNTYIVVSSVSKGQGKRDINVHYQINEVIGHVQKQVFNFRIQLT